MSQNPFKVGGSLSVDSLCYVKRQADEELYNELTQGETCFVLNARQMGKTSLSTKTLDKLEKNNYFCINIDLTRLGTPETERKWNKGFLMSLTREIKTQAQKLQINPKWWNDFDFYLWFKEHDDDDTILGNFIVNNLLAKIPKNIIICLDEIDMVLNLTFPLTELFNFIRTFKNTTEDQSYKRLTFAFIGVAYPYDILQGSNLPFNISQKIIHLSGFKSNEVQSLAEGLTDKVNDPKKVVDNILKWTGGQPLLTLKLCSIIFDQQSLITENNEEQDIEKIVKNKIIEDYVNRSYSSHSIKIHCDTIAQRVEQSKNKREVLEMYRDIQTGNRTHRYSAENPIEFELRLTGLVTVDEQNNLITFNQIYREIFNEKWIQKQLTEIALQPTIIPVEQQIEQALKEYHFCYLLIHPIDRKNEMISHIKSNLLDEQAICIIIKADDIDSTGGKDFNEDDGSDNWYYQVLKIINEQIDGLYNLHDFWREKREFSGNSARWFYARWFYEYLEIKLFSHLQGKKIVIIFDGYQPYPDVSQPVFTEVNKKVKTYHQIFEKLNFKYEVWSIIQEFLNKRLDNPDYKRLNFMVIDTPVTRDKGENISLGWSSNWGMNLSSKPQLIIDEEQLSYYFNTGDTRIIFEEVLNWTGLDPFLFQKVCQTLLTLNKPIPEGREKEEIHELFKNYTRPVQQLLSSS